MPNYTDPTLPHNKGVLDNIRRAHPTLAHIPDKEILEHYSEYSMSDMSSYTFEEWVLG